MRVRARRSSSWRQRSTYGLYYESMTSSPREASTELAATAPAPTMTWVICASRDHARGGLADDYIMANHGKRAPLEQIKVGDVIMIYSPKTTYPNGEPLRAITIVGNITGAEIEPSDVIADGYRRSADLREIEPLTLDVVRPHLPTSKLRFGCFALAPADAVAIWGLMNRART